MPAPIQESAANLDLSPRLFSSTVVVASPAAAAETIVCQLTCSGDIAVISGILVMGFAACTVGTNGVSVQAKIRRTNVSGTTVVDGGAVNEGGTAATNLVYRYVQGFDTGATMPGQVYCLTLQVASGSAASTVSAVSLIALAV